LVLSTPLIVSYFDNALIKNFMYVLTVYPWSKIILSSTEHIYIVYQKTTRLMLFRILNSIFLLSVHREENIDMEDNFISLMTSVNRIAEKFQIPIIYSMHPKSKKFIEQRGFTFHPLVQNMKPFEFIDYNHL